MFRWKFILKHKNKYDQFHQEFPILYFKEFTDDAREDYVDSGIKCSEINVGIHQNNNFADEAFSKDGKKIKSSRLELFFQDEVTSSKNSICFC